MARRTKGCLGRVWSVIHVLLNVLDTITDCSTIIVYWKDESMTVFVLALLSLVISIPISVASFFYQVKYCTGKIETKDPIITLKLVGILFESLPQLMLNLYVLAICDKGINTVQWASAAISFLSICFAIVHYDVSIRVHHDIGLIQKVFIVLYRSSYLAARILAMIYFVYTFDWWLAAVMMMHWLVGLCCIMRGQVETVSRSLALLFLNTFVYVGEFAGVTALFVLIIYVMENLLMTAITYIIRTQSNSEHNLTMTAATSTEQFGVDEIHVENDFSSFHQSSNVTNDTGHNISTFPALCADFGVLSTHIGLNVFAVVMCCLYNVSFQYTVCAGNRANAGKSAGLNIDDDELRAEFDPMDDIQNGEPSQNDQDSERQL